MNAIIIDAGYRRSRYAYETKEYGYGWFELLEYDELEKGDELEGDFEKLGEIDIVKLSDNSKYHICNEDYGMSLSAVLKKIKPSRK